MAKGRKSGLFSNPAKKLRGLMKFVFWVAAFCFVAYGVFLLVDGLIRGVSFGSLLVEAAISIIGMPVVLYLLTLGGISLLDVFSAIREIADNMNSKED